MRRFRLATAIIFLAFAAAFIASKGYLAVFADDLPPVIACDPGALEVGVAAPEAELLSGVTATDDRDGDLTARVMVGGVSKLISNSTAKITYLVFDSADNMGSLTRILRYTDYQKPRFTLKEPLIFDVGESISLTGRLLASDVVDGDISDAIRVSALDLSSNTEGAYAVTVFVTNSLGDTARVTLPVVVRSLSALAPRIELDDYLIYLNTGDGFDAGPHLVSLTDPLDKNAGPDSVVIEGQVDTGAPGTYQVTYSYTSEKGRLGVTVLTVVVEEPEVGP